MREGAIIFIIIVIIILGSIYIDKYLDKTIDCIKSNLEELKESIKYTNTSQEELSKKAEETYKIWSKINGNWSNIILHEEIDAFEISLIRAKAKIDTGKLEESLEDIDTSIFLVNHIKEKERISLKNIF